MASNEEILQFQEGIQKLLKLINTNSFDYEKEDFLLEMLTNCVDSCDMMNFEGVSRPERFKNQSKLEIRIKIDKNNRILSITDTGLGMTKQDLIANLGTLIRSKTRKLLRIINDCDDTTMISYFGIGFLSIFFVAEQIYIYSHNPDDDQYVWHPISGTEFVIKKDLTGKDLIHGTKIELHLKDGCDNYLDEEFLRNYVQDHSYEIIYPVYLNDDENDILGIGKKELPEIPKPIQFPPNAELFSETTIGDIKFEKIILPKCLENVNPLLNQLKKRINEIVTVGPTDVNRLYDILIRLTGNENEKLDLYGLLGQNFNQISYFSDQILARMVELCTFDETGQNIIKLVCLRLTSPIESIRNWYSKSFQFEGKNLEIKELYIAGIYLKQLYKCFHDDDETEENANQLRIQERILNKELPTANFLSWAIREALEDKVSLETDDI